MATLTIRWAAPDDAHGVATVHVRAWQEAYRGLIADPVLDALDVDVWTPRWSDWIAASMRGDPTDGDAHAPHSMLIAQRDDQVVGWATFGPGRDDHHSDAGELAGLYVLPDHWSLRVGHALIERVEDELRLQGFDEAYLWVLAGNDRAIRFYEAHGWTADGAEKLDDAGEAHDLRELRHRRSLR